MISSKDLSGLLADLFTIETCRFHLKRIFSKTGTRRQSELVRLMLSLPGQ